MKRSHIFLNLYLISTLVVAEPYPWELLKNRKFREHYYALLGKKIDEKWLLTLSGPAEPAKKVSILDRDYLFIHSCKPHDCDSHNMIIIYSPTSFSMYGKLVEEGVISKLGNPSAEISAALDTLYEEEFGNKVY